MILHPIDQAGEVAPGLPLSEEAVSALRAFRTLYRTLPHIPPWIGYLATEGDQVVGACAFKTLPAHGKIEIAHHTFAEAQGHGHAARMVQRLIEIARREAPEVVVIAETPPLENGSTWLLRKLGFVLAGAVHHPGDAGAVWEWRHEPTRQEPAHGGWRHLESSPHTPAE